MNRISHTKLQMYQECGRKYKFYYVDRLRSDELNSSLVFGTAIDNALNHLLLTRNLEESKDVFDKSMRTRNLNGVNLDIENSSQIVYLDSDMDNDLLLSEDKDKANKPFWSLYRKGIIILDSYTRFILPKIKEVIDIQKKIEIKNSQNDVIEGTLDLVARLYNDKIYLLDHKTSSTKYEKDSVSNSIQLTLYDYLIHNNYSLDGTGYIVLNKNIWKKKVKICSKCNHNGSGFSHRDCDNIIDGKRCHGEWNVAIDPSCYIDLILDKPNPKVQDMVLDAFDGVNEQIKNNIYLPNFSSCKRGKFVCAYYKKCYEGSDEGLKQMEVKKDETK